MLYPTHGTDKNGEMERVEYSPPAHYTDEDTGGYTDGTVCDAERLRCRGTAVGCMNQNVPLQFVLHFDARLLELRLSQPVWRSPKWMNDLMWERTVGGGQKSLQGGVSTVYCVGSNARRVLSFENKWIKVLCHIISIPFPINEGFMSHDFNSISIGSCFDQKTHLLPNGFLPFSS